MQMQKTKRELAREIWSSSLPFYIKKGRVHKLYYPDSVIVFNLIEEKFKHFKSIEEAIASNFGSIIIY